MTIPKIKVDITNPAIDEYDNPSELRKTMLGMEQLLNAARTDRAHRLPLHVFGKELLPLLLSEDPKEQEQGREYYFKSCGGNALSELILTYNDEDVCILPSPMAKIPSTAGGNLVGDIAEANLQAKNPFGGKRNMLNQVLDDKVKNFQDLSNSETFMAWEVIKTLFGYPGAFTEEQRQTLVSKKLIPDIYQLRQKFNIQIDGRESKQTTMNTHVIEDDDYETEWE